MKWKLYISYPQLPYSKLKITVYNKYKLVALLCKKAMKLCSHMWNTSFSMDDS